MDEELDLAPGRPGLAISRAKSAHRPSRRRRQVSRIRPRSSEARIRRHRRGAAGGRRRTRGDGRRRTSPGRNANRDRPSQRRVAFTPEIRGRPAGRTNRPAGDPTLNKLWNLLLTSAAMDDIRSPSNRRSRRGRIEPEFHEGHTPSKAHAALKVRSVVRGRWSS